jgi:hypothetical protein
MLSRSVAVVLCLVAGSGAAGATCAPENTPDLAPPKPAPVLFSHCPDSGLCGAISSDGKWKIPPDYQEVLIEGKFVLGFVEGTSDVTFFDGDGKELFQGVYETARDEGLYNFGSLLIVRFSDKYGAVDHAGKVVIPPTQYDFISGFYEGLSSATIGEKTVYIDEKGAQAFPGEFDDGGNFGSHYAVVQKNEKYGLIDKAGNVILDPRFDELVPHGKVVLGYTGEEDSIKVGILSGDGSWAVEPKFSSIDSFSNGLAPASLDGEKWGFIDTCGNWQIAPKYSNVSGFDGGPARVEIDGKWGLIDQKGNAIVPAKYDAFVSSSGESVAGDWTEGLIVFMEGDKYGIMAADGKIVRKPDTDGALTLLGAGLVQSWEDVKVEEGEEERITAVISRLAGTRLKIEPPPESEPTGTTP